MAGARFGIRTDTGDITGAVSERSELIPARSDIEAVLPCFTGDIMQTQPIYSALKKDGRPLYEYARRGVEVDIEPRAAHVDSLSLVSFDGDEAVFAVACRSGTYIRTLIEDIAARAGALAAMSSLRRTAASGVDISRCVTPERIEAGERPLITAEEMFSHLPACTVPESGLRYYKNGGVIAESRFDVPVPGLSRAYSCAGDFLGLCGSADGGVKCLWLESIYDSTEETDADTDPGDRV